LKLPTLLELLLLLHTTNKAEVGCLNGGATSRYSPCVNLANNQLGSYINIGRVNWGSREIGATLKAEPKIEVKEENEF
jgi:hypothetical protein